MDTLSLEVKKQDIVSRTIGRWIENPLQLIFFALCNFVVGVVCYMLVEGVGWQDAGWFYSITGSTTGYGDMYPKTLGGRCIAIEIVLSNWLVFSLLMVHFLNKYLTDQHKFTHSEQEHIKDLLGALLVQSRLIYQLIVDNHRTKMAILMRIKDEQKRQAEVQERQEAFNLALANHLGMQDLGTTNTASPNLTKHV